MGRRTSNYDPFANDKRNIFNPGTDKDVLGFVLMPSTFQPRVVQGSPYSFNDALLAAAWIRQDFYADATNVRVFALAMRDSRLTDTITENKVNEESRAVLDVHQGVADLFHQKIEQIQGILAERGKQK